MPSHDLTSPEYRAKQEVGQPILSEGTLLSLCPSKGKLLSFTMIILFINHGVGAETIIPSRLYLLGYHVYFRKGQEKVMVGVKE